MSQPNFADMPIDELVPAACAQIPDFPHEGILFYDVTTLFANPVAFKRSIDELADRFEGTYDIVAGVEARGFLMAAALAYKTGKGVMTVRKAGKLPRETFQAEYTLEYGTAAIEIHKEDIPAGERVLILDDILATGGTVQAAISLMKQAKLEVAGVGFLMELDGLGGRDKMGNHRVETLSLTTE